ncbi:MAG: hypothetical protein LC792_15185, partial [Actinobacteria bacterium]|nr:hypothetical protein [Actinomycetota bacterium]
MANGQAVQERTQADALAREPQRAANQLAVSVVATVERSRIAALRRTLARMGLDPGANRTWPFARIPRAHFARLVLLEATEDPAGRPVDAQLVYIADVDEPANGGQERRLRELVDAAGDGLDRTFGACAGYPRGEAATPETRLGFVRDHAVAPAAAYVNTVGRTVQQIRDEAELRTAIGGFLDKIGDWSGQAPEEVRAAIQDFVRTEPGLDWVAVPPPGPSLAARVADGVDLLRFPLTLLALSPVIVPSLPLVALLLRLNERRDPSP